MTLAPPCPLTIIIVDYHSQPHLADLLPSLARFQPDAPVIISSNSEYPPAEWQRLTTAYPTVQWLRNDGNLGYAGGVNQALRRVRTPYAAVLNPDVTLCEPLVPAVEATFAQEPLLGLFGPRVLDGAGTATFSFRRFYPPTYILARYCGLGRLPMFRAITGHYLMQDAPRDQFTYADWVSGGAMFFRLDAAHAVGPMDERYFLYMEDMDWCRSFWRAGWRVGYTPALTVVHRAQHAGTRRGLAGLFSRSARLQITAYFKYLRKWGRLAYAPAAALHH